MFVEQADQASTIPLFDETSAAVFACLCRLTDGDGRRALAVLIDVYVAAADEPRTPRDLSALTGLARRLYLAVDRSPNAIERVIADMHFVDHCAISDIARAVDRTEEQVRTTVDALAATSAFDPRHGEMWFDDVLRAEAQLAIAERLPHSDDSPAAIGRSRRRTGFAVALAAAGLLIALTVWVRSGDDADNGTTLPTVAPTTTTSAATTAASTTAAPTAVATTVATATDFTMPSDTAASPPTASPGYVLDPLPPGYVGIVAFDSLSEASSDGPSYPIEVWASADAGPGSGRWLALEVADDDPSVGLYTFGSRGEVLQRLEIAGHPSLMSTNSTGIQHLLVPIGDGRLLDVLSYGIDLDSVAALIAATTIGPDYVPTFGEGADAALDGLNLIASLSSHQSRLIEMGFVPVDASAHYGIPNTDSFLSISSAPQGPNDLRIVSLLIDGSTSIPSEVIEIDGRNVLIGTIQIDESRAYRFAIWHEGSQTISITGELTLDDMTLAVRASRAATADEWQAFLDADPNWPEFGSDPPERPVHTEEIGSVTTTEGSSWTIRLSDADLGFSETEANSIEILQLSTPESDSSFQPSMQHQLPLPIDPNDPLTNFETPNATILIAAFDAPTEAAFMRVTLYRRTPVDIPIVAVPETALSGAAFVFSELVPYTIDLIDANGAVLQTVAS